jgi:c-di-GMP-binding flagellar brake protein YcgR
MGLISLIFSRDERTVRILKLLLADLEIEAEVVADFARAQEDLRRRKFDGIFAECEEEEGATLLRSVKKSKHNKRSIAFALSGTEVKMGAAFEMGAHFVVHKPLVSEKVKRTLKAAHGLMMREQRSQYRHPASTHVSVKSGSNTAFSGSLRDLSQGGALIESVTVLRKGQPIQLRFVLPETEIPIEAVGHVSWSDPMGRAGVEFKTLPDAAQQELTRWVIQRSMEEDPPDEVSVIETASAPAQTKITDADEGLELQVEIVEPETEDSRLRATLRAQHQAPLKVLAFDGGKPVVAHGKCINLSELGMAADLDEDLKLDDAVLVMITLPDSSTMTLHAHIRYQDEKRYGVEFVALSEIDRKLLHAKLSDLPVE